MERIEAICDLLVAAAHADGRYGDSERKIIRELLCGIIQAEVLDPKLEARIAFGKAEDIDVEALIALFENDSTEKKRLLMQLIVAVSEADGLYDIEEDEFVIYVAGALGFNTDEIQEFSLDLEEDTITLKLGVKDLVEMDFAVVGEVEDD